MLSEDRMRSYNLTLALRNEISIVEHTAAVRESVGAINKKLEKIELQLRDELIKKGKRPR